MINKLKGKKGGISTILAYAITFLPLLYLILVSFTWQIRDNTEDYISSTLRTAIDITTKRGVFDEDVKSFITNKIGDSSGNGIYRYGVDYAIYIGKQSYEDIGGELNTWDMSSINSANQIYFKVGDVAYAQFEIINNNKEPMVSRLIKLIGDNNGAGFDKLLIVQQGMVEVNGN